MNKNKAFKIFSEKALVAFQEAIAQKEFQDTINKDLEEANGTFEVIASVETPDRIGDVVKMDGLDKKNYLKNPTILWNHDYSIPPIGKAIDVRIDGNKLIIKGIFANNDFAQQIRKDYEAGFQKAVSIGFIAKKRDEKDFDIILEWELLELSFVAIGMHQDALDNLKKALGDEEVANMVKMGAIKVAEVVEDEPETPQEATEEEEKGESDNEPTEEEKEATEPKTEEKEEVVEEDQEEEKELDEKTISAIDNAVAKAIEKAFGIEKSEEDPKEEVEEDEENKEDVDFENMTDEEKAMFMHDMKKMLQKSTEQAQITLRDIKRAEK